MRARLEASEKETRRARERAAAAEEEASAAAAAQAAQAAEAAEAAAERARREAEAAEASAELRAAAEESRRQAAAARESLEAERESAARVALELEVGEVLGVFSRGGFRPVCGVSWEQVLSFAVLVLCASVYERHEFGASHCCSSLSISVQAGGCPDNRSKSIILSRRH